MKPLFPFLAVAIAIVLTTPGTPGQSPASRDADPGVTVTDPSTGIGAPVGWRITHHQSLLGTLTTPASAMVGPNGDLYFTESVGSGCSPSASTHIWRVPMSAPQSAPVQYTTAPINGHHLAYDPMTNALYATGTCDQTSDVYRIPASGVPELLNPGTPLNDPDGLAVGTLPGMTGPQLLVVTQDGLFAFDLMSGTTPTATQITLDLSATGAASIGNWGFPIWDPNTNTLLATDLGRPATFETVEITFTSATTGVAQVIAPDNLPPQTVDVQGVRWWRSGGQIGIVNPNGGSPVFRPVIDGIGTASVACATGSGSFFLIDSTMTDLHQLDRPFATDTLSVSASQTQFVDLSLQAPPGRFSEGYMIFLSASGSSPGTPYGPVMAPINQDIVLQAAYILALANDPLTFQWVGFLDAFGQASAQFRFYANILPSNVTFNLCYLLGNPEYASNAAWIHVLP